MPGNPVFVFRPPVMVQRHLQGFYLSFFLPLHFVYGMSFQEFCIPQTFYNCYSFYPWVLLAGSPTDALIGPLCFLVQPKLSM